MCFKIGSSSCVNCCARLKIDRVVKDHAKILGRHGSIGRVVSIAETQPAIPQRTGGDAVVHSRVDLFFPATSGHAAIGIGAKRSNTAESELRKVVSNSDAIGFLARLIEVGNHQRVEGGIPTEGIADGRSAGRIVKLQGEQSVGIACGELGAVELGVEGSEQFCTDTALVDELGIAADLEVLRALPGVAALHIGTAEYIPSHLA